MQYAASLERGAALGLLLTALICVIILVGPTLGPKNTGIAILEAPDDVPSLTAPVLETCRWIADYYAALRANCKGCKILGADVLDQSNVGFAISTPIGLVLAAILGPAERVVVAVVR